ncbi:hypothetical protein EYF80_013788 [Liparis tanakae]|uniref:Uncharacterized protein n=1 Tax=Liparis tanakae TaxID=230148 RepID=A0A4Z2IEL3_9TELE|nr:hypothetical protein EYF80_013788 [Liparis tanakae]
MTTKAGDVSVLEISTSAPAPTQHRPSTHAGLGDSFDCRGRTLLLLVVVLLLVVLLLLLLLLLRG